MALMFWCNVLGYTDVDVVDIHPEKESEMKNLMEIFAYGRNRSGAKI